MISRSAFGSAYDGKAVLVTGHTGFKGSWLAIWLGALGARVVGYALAPETPSLFEQAGLAARLTHVEGDVTDYDHLRAVMAEEQPDYVFHLAAQALVRPSYSDPRRTYETNVLGTVNVLEAIRHTPSVRAAVIVTSDKCYENREWEYAYRENDALGGFDPYSSSKGCAELVTAGYRNSFFNGESAARIASARAGNVVGGGDWAVDRIVPDCIRALSRGVPIEVRNPGAVRPWQFVLEPLSGYLWLGSQLVTQGQAVAGAWNFGPNPQGNVPVREVADRMVRHWGSGSWRGPDVEAAGPHEARFLRLDCTKAANGLHWMPVYDIERTLEVTTRWYREQAQGAQDAFERCLADIAAYEQVAVARKVAWATP
jgi:CDP-glucose 4,6-dehydratase